MRTRNSLILFLVLSLLGSSSIEAKESVSSATTIGAPTLSLEECYRLALIQSETVAIQKEAISRATAQIFNAASQGLGNVDFIIDRTFQDSQKTNLSGNSGLGNLGDPNIQESKFAISQPLFQGFKAIGALTGAGSYKREQTEAWIRAKELLYTDVARAFYNVLRYEKEIEINQDVHELLGKRIQELEAREKIGRSRTSEVITAQTNLKILEADLAAAQGALATVRYLLEFLTGTELGERRLDEETFEEVSSKTLTEHLKMAAIRSDVQAAEQAVKTAWRGILVAQSGFWPTITLTHNQYMRREGTLANLDFDTLFKFDIPLFSGGETIGQVKDSIGILKQKKLYFSLAKRQAELDIKQSYQVWLSAKETNELLKEAVRDAEKNYATQSEEYTRSLVSNLDVLAALESLHNTRQRQNLTYYVMKQDEAAFRVAIGEVS
ncbi:MAG: TolC family protein [Candidatus Omnitrophica bacterium]|nr:TolC family protein [Candidatus Omnitrophota bacterium]